MRDTIHGRENFTIKWKIKETVLAKNWANLLISNVLNSNHPIEKTYCLFGWQTTWDSNYSRNLEVLCVKLNDAIAIINQNMCPLGYNKINLDFTVDKLKSNDHQTLMNEIHHHFELLIGQIWNVSEWYKKTPNELTRTAIRMLNNYCHEIESAIRVINIQTQLSLEKFSALLYAPCTVNISCNGVNNQGKYYLTKNLKYLSLPEFECFQNHTAWGDVTLYYAQLGKTHLDAFRDQDEYIDRKNISSHQTITGEFVIDFSPGEIIQDDFKAWCEKHDFDLNDKTLGIGFPVVASIENPFLTEADLVRHIRKYNDLYQIGVEDDQGSITATKIYDYTWKDEEEWKCLQS